MKLNSCNNKINLRDAAARVSPRRVLRVICICLRFSECSATCRRSNEPCLARSTELFTHFPFYPIQINMFYEIFPFGIDFVLGKNKFVETIWRASFPSLGHVYRFMFRKLWLNFWSYEGYFNKSSQENKSNQFSYVVIKF